MLRQQRLALEVHPVLNPFLPAQTITIEEGWAIVTTGTSATGLNKNQWHMTIQDPAHVALFWKECRYCCDVLRTPAVWTIPSSLPLHAKQICER